MTVWLSTTQMRRQTVTVTGEKTRSSWLHPGNLNLMDMAPRSEKPNVRIWFSSTGLVACMHYDTSHNTHSVVYGAKRIMVRAVYLQTD
jgi:hypothetical protein